MQILWRALPTSAPRIKFKIFLEFYMFHALFSFSLNFTFEILLLRWWLLQSPEEVSHVNVPQILRLALPNSAHRMKFYVFRDFFSLIMLFDFILRLACALDKATFNNFCSFIAPARSRGSLVCWYTTEFRWCLAKQCP